VRTLIACSLVALCALYSACSGDKLAPPVAEADGSAPDDASSGVDAAGPPGTTTNVTIIVEPSDSAAGIIAAISGAKKSVHMTMYLLSSQPVIDALIARKKAGVEVSVVLNQTFPSAGSDNGVEFAQLNAAGIKVVWAAATYQYTHEKCVIIDGQVAWIMTMNLTASSATQNREFLAVDSDPEDVAEAETIFQADFAHQPPTITGKLLVAPVNAQAGMLALLDAAKSTIDLEGESLSDTKITASLIAAKQRGVVVRVVLSDQTPTAAMQAAVNNLKAAKVAVVKTGTPYIHSKAFVVDGVKAYVGSENFTYNSLASNRELGVIVGAPTEIAKVSAAIATDFAKGVAY
jgi:hypothetical protein